MHLDTPLKSNAVNFAIEELPQLPQRSQFIWEQVAVQILIFFQRNSAVEQPVIDLAGSDLQLLG